MGLSKYSYRKDDYTFKCQVVFPLGLTNPRFV